MCGKWKDPAESCRVLSFFAAADLALNYFPVNEKGPAFVPGPWCLTRKFRLPVTVVAIWASGGLDAHSPIFAPL